MRRSSSRLKKFSSCVRPGVLLVLVAVSGCKGPGRAVTNSRATLSNLPITNLGRNPEEIAIALQQLGAGYARIGRTADAATFMRKAAELN